MFQQHMMAMDVMISDGNGKPLNARVEVRDETIIVHSRSGGPAGAQRNPDYRLVVEAILSRLDQEQIQPTVYLDSSRVAHLKLDQRVIAAAGTLTGTVSDRFNQLVRNMNAGSKSHGAWRRISFDVPGRSRGALTAIVTSGPLTKPMERLPFETLHKVKPKHVREAADEIAAGHAMPFFAPSREYDLIYDDTVRLAPKQVFGRALELATGIAVRPQHFTGGLGTPSFRALEEAGFAVIAKEGDSAAAVAEVTSGLDMNAEDKTFVEGSVKRAYHLVRERNRKLVETFRTEFVEKYGKLLCEDCTDDLQGQYGDDAVACFEAHHATVQVGDMPKGGHHSTTTDLRMLCANCHRAEHRRMRLMK